MSEKDSDNVYIMKILNSTYLWRNENDANMAFGKCTRNC